MHTFLAHTGHNHEEVLQTKGQILDCPLALIATTMLAAAIIAVALVVLTRKTESQGENT